MSLDVSVRPPRTDILQPVLPEWCALGWRHLLYVVVWTAFGMYLSYIPVFHSDIWGHVNYGQWILEHRRLPVEDPFTPLAEGVPVIDTAWLGQVLYALAWRGMGPNGISHLFALTVLATFLIHLRTLMLRAGRADVASFACVLVFIVTFSRHAIARPEVFGNLCFAILLWLVTRADRGVSPAQRGDADWTSRPDARVPWSLYLGVPLVHLAWANLHGSFIVGIVFLGCKLLGRVAEVLWKTPDPMAVLRDPWVRRWALLTELAIGATVINPYGFDLLLNVFQFSSNPNLKDVVEWYPMDGKSLEGIHFLIAMVVLMVLWRHSARVVLPADVLMTAIFAVATFPSVRMIGWFAAIAGYVAAPHLGEVLPRWFKGAFDEIPKAQRSFRLTAVCGLLLWTGFAFSPISQPVLGGRGRAEAETYSKDTPTGVTRYLREHPPKGQVFNPQWWGDWLAWDGPRGMQVFMTTNAVHVAPQTVWRDYLHIAQGRDGWERLLTRYNVRTFIVHKEMQGPTWQQARKMPGWKKVYEDDVAAVLVKVEDAKAEPEAPKDRAVSIKSNK